MNNAQRGMPAMTTWSLLVFNRTFNPCSIPKLQRSLIRMQIENNEKTFWSFQITSNVTCLKTNIKTIPDCSVTWISLVTRIYRLLPFTSIFSMTRPALSWDQLLLSFPLVKRFPAGNVNWKVSHLVQYVYTCI